MKSFDKQKCLLEFSGCLAVGHFSPKCWQVVRELAPLGICPPKTAFTSQLWAKFYMVCVLRDGLLYGSWHLAGRPWPTDKLCFVHLITCPIGLETFFTQINKRSIRFLRNKSNCNKLSHTLQHDKRLSSLFGWETFF